VCGPDGKERHQALGGGLGPRGLAKTIVWASLRGTKGGAGGVARL